MRPDIAAGPIGRKCSESNGDASAAGCGCLLRSPDERSTREKHRRGQGHGKQPIEPHVPLLPKT